MMRTFTTTSANAGPMRIDGIDVGRLLRDIGEASANTAAVDLFGLLLGAQRVLAQVPVGSQGGAR